MTTASARIPSLLGLSVALGGLVLLMGAIVVLHLPPEMVLALLVGGAIVPIFVLRPIVGLHLLIALIYVENVITLHFEVTGLQIVGAIVVAAWLLHVLVRRSLGIPYSPAILLIGLFVAWSLLTTLTALDSAVAMTSVVSYVQLAILALMTVSVLDRPSRLVGVYRAVVLWTCLSAGYGLIAFYSGESKVVSGTVLNRNLMAIYLNLAVVCALILYQVSTRRLERLALMLSLPVLILSLALTLSRTGLISLSAGILLVWYRLVQTRRYLILLLSITIIALVGLVLPDVFFERAATIVPVMEERTDTFGTRIALWESGARMLGDHPLVGVGPGNFIVALPRYGRGLEHFGNRLVSHNAYVGIAAESGVPGLLLFCLLFVAAFRAAEGAARLLRTSQRPIALLGVGAEISLFTILVNGLTGNIEILKYTYLLLGICVAVSNLARRATAEELGLVSSPEGP